MVQNYRELLLDQRWREKSARILVRDLNSCIHPYHVKLNRKPVAVFAQLNVGEGKDLLPWEYSDDLFQSLCETCHRDVEWRNGCEINTKRNQTLEPKFPRLPNDAILSQFIPRHTCPWTQRDAIRDLRGALGEGLDLFEGIDREKKIEAVIRYLLLLEPIEEELLLVLQTKGSRP